MPLLTAPSPKRVIQRNSDPINVKCAFCLCGLSKFIFIDWTVGSITVIKVLVKKNSPELFEAIVNSYQMLLNSSSSV